MAAHLHVQLTLLPTGNSTLPVEFRTVLARDGRHFSALIQSRQPVAPGGPAVHCSVTFLAPDVALKHFPAGSQFELWERGRKGYGTVLRVA
jgi:hypothetical protein